MSVSEIPDAAAIECFFVHRCCLHSQPHISTRNLFLHAVDPDKERSILGKGAFGTVYKMINPHDHQSYAVKELTNLTNDDGSTDEVAMHELLEEVRKMGVVQSEFIVQYRTSAVYRGRFYVMMEPIVSLSPSLILYSQSTAGAKQIFVLTLPITLLFQHTARSRLSRRRGRPPNDR